MSAAAVTSDTDASEVIRRLKNLSRTQWTIRGAAAEVLLEKYHALEETVKVVSTDKSVTAEC